MTEYQQLDAKLDEVLQRITAIETTVARQGDLCPHRELLARAANNIDRMRKMEETVTSLRLTVARYGAVAGAIAGIGGSVITAVVMGALGL